jgi:hypothetical protein
MVSIRRRTTTLLALPAGVLLAAALLPAAVLLGAAPASAADIFVQVDPSTVQAGYLVGIRASCRENNAAGTVESPAFGRITVYPQNGFLTAAAMVPANTRPDTYRVRLSCPDGKSATTQLIVVAGGRPSHGPATGFGGTANKHPGALLLAGGVGTTALGAMLGLLAVRRRNESVRRPLPRRAGR